MKPQASVLYYELIHQLNNAYSATPPDLSSVQALTDEQRMTIFSVALDKLVNHIDLPFEEMQVVMLLIMQGQCPDAMLGAMLSALRMKGESIDEITAAASVMRELATSVDIGDTPYQVDIVGTGGDGANLFNVSTAAAMVAAAAGCCVAKHGNRGVSTSSGSSDLLEQAGISLALTPEQTATTIKAQGVGFLFAPNHHAAMRYAIPVRRALKIRTIFNILGPLTNPAGVPNLVIGVFTPTLCEPLAHVMKNLGANHVMIVGSYDGLDEISLATRTQVAELKNGEVEVYDLEPEDVGIESQTLKGLGIESSSQSLALIQAAFTPDAEQLPENRSGKPALIIQKARDMIALNAGAAIYVAGRADSLGAGVSMAQTVIVNGSALQKMQDLAKFTQQF